MSMGLVVSGWGSFRGLMVGSGAHLSIASSLFAAQQDKLKSERRAAKRLQTTATAQLDDVQAALDLALSRVEKPYEVYRDGTELERRIMNRAIFERIEIGEDGQITGTTLMPVYDALSAWQPRLGRPQAGQAATQAQDGPCSPYVRLPTASFHSEKRRL